MRAEHGAIPVDDLTRRCAELLVEPAAGVTVGDEADVVRVGLLREREPARLRLGAHLGLRGRRTEREHRVRELLAGEHAEHVGLVLRPGGGAVQLAVAVVIHGDRRVVAGGDRVEAERDGLLEQRSELDVLVAAHARVGGAVRRRTRR